MWTQQSHCKTRSNFFLFLTQCYCPPDKVLVIAGTLWSSAFTESTVVFCTALSAGGYLWLSGIAAPFSSRLPPETALSFVLLTRVRCLWTQRKIHSAGKKQGALAVLVKTSDSGCKCKSSTLTVCHSWKNKTVKKKKRCTLLEHHPHPLFMNLTCNAICQLQN